MMFNLIHEVSSFVLFSVLTACSSFIIFNENLRIFCKAKYLLSLDNLTAAILKEKLNLRISRNMTSLD